MLGLTKSSFSHEDCTLGYHQKKNREVSKYYENDYLQRFLLLFMSLLIAKLVKKSCISTRTHFIFRRNVLKQTWKFFSTKFGSLWIYRQNSYKVRQIFVIFSHLIAPILLVKEIRFQGFWGKFNSTVGFQRASVTKYVRQTLVFTWNSTLLEKFNLYFSTVFC